MQPIIKAIKGSNEYSKEHIAEIIAEDKHSGIKKIEYMNFL